MRKDITRLNQSEENEALKFYEKVKNGQITQGVCCYRLKNGDIRYFLINSAHLTYIIGLMERIKNHILS